jgi:hypothetical protein
MNNYFKINLFSKKEIFKIIDNEFIVGININGNKTVYLEDYSKDRRIYHTYNYE